MNVCIREFCPDDYSSIAGLVKNELGYPQVDANKLYARLEAMKADGKYKTFVAEAEGRVVGFIGIFIGIAYNYDEEVIQISAMAVLKELQNKGIGSQLIKWVELFAIANNMHIIKLTSRLHRAEAHAFYESNGYIKKSYGYSKDV